MNSCPIAPTFMKPPWRSPFVKRICNGKKNIQSSWPYSYRDQRKIMKQKVRK